MITKSTRAVLLSAALCIPGLACAQSFCVFDPLGSQGDYASLAKDYQLAAKRWGVNIDIVIYTDDDKLDADFRANKCDMASMIGMRARSFNLFTGTLDAPGVMDNYVEVREAMDLIASPKVAKYMLQDNYEVVGVLPVGAAYSIVNDRRINSLETAAGHKVAIMAWDKTQKTMCDDMHVVAVPTTLAQSAVMFNKGQVDFIVTPAVMYKPMELSKGIGSKGGIIRRPLFQFSMQFVALQNKFPPSFGQQSRQYVNQQVNHALGIIHNNEADIDARQWIYALHSEVLTWDISMRKIIAHLVKDDDFDPRMLGVLKRIRCKNNVEEPECAPTPAQQNLK
jgi:hypothetical protein